MNYLPRAALILGLAASLGLTACGSSGGGKTTRPPGSSVSSLSSVSQSSSSQTSSSSSSSSSLPTHASNGTIYCTPAGTDPDGDGWGWENNASCIVRNSAADPDKGDFDGCIIDTSSWPYCTADNGSWGLEDSQVCVSRSFCPANRSGQQAPLSDTLVSPEASPKAKAVYDFLRTQWGEKMLSGQQDLTWQDSTDMFQRVINDTGKAPAIMGYDFMNYRYTSGSGLQQTEEAIAHADRGGLVTFCWHWRDPSRITDKFYSNETGFQIPIANGALDTANPVFEQINADIDQIAGELKRLEDAGVVVLWRPLHEASGGWFWWGRPRADGIAPAYAQVLLWRHLFDRLTNHHQLSNLIWVWNGQGAAWYPGDAYVDIVGMDIYDTPRSYGSQIGKYAEAGNYSLQVKPVALTENSNIPDPDKMAEDGAWWLWFVVWNDGTGEEGVSNSNNFWTGDYYNTLAHKQHVYNHPRVLTLEDLPAFD